MGKNKRIVHILSLFLTIVIMYFLSKVLLDHTEFITEHQDALPYILVIILILAGCAAYFLYQKEKTK